MDATVASAFTWLPFFVIDSRQEQTTLKMFPATPAGEGAQEGISLLLTSGGLNSLFINNLRKAIWAKYNLAS